MQPTTDTIKKSVRLVALIRRFATGGRYTARELAETFGVSQRSIQRDLLDLQSAPLRLPLVQDSEWKWSIME